MLGTYLTLPHMGYLDALVGGPHYYYVDPTLGIATCSGVGLSPLGDKAACQAFHRGLRLSTQQAI